MWKVYMYPYRGDKAYDYIPQDAVTEHTVIAHEMTKAEAKVLCTLLNKHRPKKD